MPTYVKTARVRRPTCTTSLRYEEDDVTVAREGDRVVSYIEVRCFCGEVLRVNLKFLSVLAAPVRYA